MHACMHAYIHTYIHLTYIYIYTHVYIYIYIYICLCMCIYVCIYSIYSFCSDDLSEYNMYAVAFVQLDYASPPTHLPHTRCKQHPQTAKKCLIGGLADLRALAFG